MIPQSLLNNYRKEVDQAGNEASKYIQAVIETYRSQYPNASVSEIRDYTRNAMRDVLYLYGGQSALISNDFFERVAQENGEELSTEIYETIDYDKADEKIRYFAKSLVTGDITDFDHSISDLTKYYVKREAFENLVKNCDKHGLRYARVPSGRETCAFCFMLASRGFVYWSEEDAGGMGHKYHSHCDCVIVPGFHKSSGVNEDEQVEGYKPSKLYERYQMCYDSINPDGTWSLVYEKWKNSDTEDTWEQFKTHQLMAEINKRDTKWLWTGKPAEVTYPDENFLRIEKKENRYHELRTAQRIAANGLKVEFQYDQRIDKSSPRRETIGYADFKNGWEIKTLMDAKTEYSAVKNSYEKSVGKVDRTRLIIDNYESKYLSDNEVVKQIKAQNSNYEGFDWVSMINKQGVFIDVIKKN